MRDLLKAIPLAVMLPLTIGAASVGPDDAILNVAKWANFLGVKQIPLWLTYPSNGHVVVGLGLVSSLLYVCIVWRSKFASLRVRSVSSLSKDQPMNDSPIYQDAKKTEIVDGLIANWRSQNSNVPGVPSIDWLNRELARMGFGWEVAHISYNPPSPAIRIDGFHNSLMSGVKSIGSDFVLDLKNVTGSIVKDIDIKK